MDRRGAGIVPIGIESFDDLAARFVYVDKTMLAAELIDHGGVTLFCRPRRFGKSTALRMLQSYLEEPVDGWVEHDPSLFADLAILKAGNYYVREQAAHPVIYLGLNSCGGDTWEEMRASIARLMSEEYARHYYLATSSAIPKFQQEQFEQFCKMANSSEELDRSLSFLATLLHRFHHSKTVILIDEYDKIVTEGYLHGYQDQATDFLKRWLTRALKGTVDLYLAALTGVQRVSKESIFSDLNNFTVDTALDHQYREAFGFTQGEVEALASKLGHANTVSELAAWYDGYDFGGEAIYNPWSVLNYFRQGCVAQPYWTNTSSNDVVRRLIGRANEDANAQLTALAEGGVVEEPLDLSVVYGQIDSDTAAIWSQLYLAGYITTHDVDEPNNADLVRDLVIPNLEVSKLFSRELVARAQSAAGGRHALATLHESLVSGDAAVLAHEIGQALLNTVSYHDLRSENSCHMWLLSLLYGMAGFRFPRSNRETGHGRPDIVCEPDAAHAMSYPAVVVEVKFVRDGSPGELQATADAALSKQALPKRYAHGLAGNGRVMWSVTFDAHKHVAVAKVV